MKIINKNSLAKTIDHLNEIFFYDKIINPKEKITIAKWVAGFQGKLNSYRGMFAPSEKDLKGIRTFTGERIISNAAIRHILSQESCRALILLDVKNSRVQKALNKATKSFYIAMKHWIALNKPQGMYCCGLCTVSYWRHLAVGGLNKQEEMLTKGLKILKSNRNGSGKWNRFPYWFILLTLDEIDLLQAKDEIKYALSGCENVLKRQSKDKYSRRKKELAKRILNKF